MSHSSDNIQITGQLVDIHRNTIFPARVHIAAGKISKIEAIAEAPQRYIMPGFVDAHVHVESSMLVPSEFGRLAVVHGSVGSISDPHEIGNVLGVDGVRYMIDNGKKVPFKFYFGAPSCVPATPFETAGAEINAADVETLLSMPEVVYLAEMMNWPGVLHQDALVYEKIALAKRLGKPVDGHAPGLKGEQAKAYIAAGISTDHECFSAKEAQDKLTYGMKILIREGSAAKNFEALADLLHEHSDMMMFCSDDKHPDNLVEGHINQLVARAVAKGVDLFKALHAASRNPVEHYGMNIGLLREGDPADFIITSDLENFKVEETWINGQKVAEGGNSLIPSVENTIVNQFDCSEKTAEDFQVVAASSKIRVIEALDGQLITPQLDASTKVEDGLAVSDVENDVLKIAVINRYADAPPAIAFIKNIGLKRGAIASSVAHDSHNIIVVGTDDLSMARAANLVIKAKGGVSAVDGARESIVALPVAGLMSEKDGYEVARAYSAIDRMAKEMGSTLNSPFMTLSFMALLVIPSLKLSDKGLFDGDNFRFTGVFQIT